MSVLDLALAIGAGIWLGGVALALTAWAVIEIGGRIGERIKRNRRFGVPWWHGIVWSENR